MQILGFVLGATQILGFTLAPQGFLSTNMLVSPTHSHVEGIAQREGFYVAVEYRL